MIGVGGDDSQPLKSDHELHCQKVVTAALQLTILLANF